MADIRCPMCGKPNPAENAECQFCGSRLKPLIIKQPDEPPRAAPSPSEVRPQPPSPPPAETVHRVAPAAPAEEPSSAPGNVPPWLARLRAETGAKKAGQTEPPPPPPAPAEPSPSAQTSGPSRAQPAEKRSTTGKLFHSLRIAATQQTISEKPEPESPAPAEADVPDWLRSLRAHTVAREAESAPPSPTPKPAEETADWLQSLRGQAAAAAPTAAPPTPVQEDADWLTALRGQATSAAGPAAPEAEPEAPTEEAPAWLRPPPLPAEEPPAVTGVEDWLATSAEQPEERDESWPASFTATPPEPAPAGDLPDWLAAPPAGSEQPPAVTGEAPEWVSSLAPESSAPSAELPEWLAPPAETRAPATEEPPAAPDWLASLAPVEAAPPSEAPPVTPPVTPGEADFDFLTPPPAESEAPAPGGATPADLPDWLAALRPTGYDVSAPPFEAGPSEFPPPPAPEPPSAVERAAAKPMAAQPTEGKTSDVTKAALPPWLEAMRPIAVAQPTAPELEDYEETAGPLAGMRGVLVAEPMAVLPTATKVTAAARPTVSETHAAQVKLLEQLVSAETAPRAAAAARARPMLALVERWAVFLILLAAVAAPFVAGGSFFAAPAKFPAETMAARDAVAQVPAELPVLIAFEYEPGSAGELDLQAEALLSHLAQRTLRVVAVSTRPSGALVAQSALEHTLGKTGAYTYGTNYVNLGYLPGGPIGLAAFAAQPREALPVDFLIGYDRTVPLLDVWQMPALAGVNRASDFGLIAVIGNSPDAVRIWIEQVKPLAPRTPMIALVSASAEPLVQPYYLDNPNTPENEAADGPLQGVASGLFGAVSYEQSLRAGAGQPAGLSGAAAQRWDAQAYGLLAAVLVIASGAVIFGSLSLLQRGGKRGP